jgi:hypothetical protein
MNATKSPREVVLEWVAAYNARDPRALAELYHEDATNHQVALGEPMVGKEQMLESFTAFFHAFPDNFTHIEQLFESGGSGPSWSGTGAPPGRGSSTGWPLTGNPSRCGGAASSTSWTAR